MSMKINVFCLLSDEQPELPQNMAFKSLIDVLFHSQTNTVVTRDCNI